MSRKILGLIYTVAILVFGYYLFMNAWSNQGYSPAQPIPFSHKLHAGDNHIPCMYCHTNVERSRHATVPGLSICMNCHSVVAVNKPNIQKLTEAYNAGTPIEWIKVHDLPDHAFFSHQMHIRKGFDCAECHGPVEAMDQVYQFRKLNMGDCITCHRENGGPTTCSTCHQ
jgi:hypothetical protein